MRAIPEASWIQENAAGRESCRGMPLSMRGHIQLKRSVLVTFAFDQRAALNMCSAVGEDSAASCARRSRRRRISFAARPNRVHTLLATACRGHRQAPVSIQRSNPLRPPALGQAIAAAHSAPPGDREAQDACPMPRCRFGADDRAAASCPRQRPRAQAPVARTDSAGSAPPGHVCQVAARTCVREGTGRSQSPLALARRLQARSGRPPVDRPAAPAAATPPRPGREGAERRTGTGNRREPAPIDAARERRANAPRTSA